MPSDCKYIDPNDRWDSPGYIEDFFDYNSGDMWTSLAADTGSSVAAAGGHGGILLLTCGGDDNDECAVATTNTVYLPAANKPGVCKLRAQFADADSLAANIALGFSSIFTANFITDGGAALAASFSGAVFFKKDQDTYWSVAVSNGATQTITRTNIVASNANYHDFEVRIMPFSSTQFEVTYFYDGQQARDANGDTIKHYALIASIAAMKVGMYAKQGGTTAQTANLDTAAWIEKR
jgi:hypothetical protein